MVTRASVNACAFVCGASAGSHATGRGTNTRIADTGALEFRTMVPCATDARPAAAGASTAGAATTGTPASGAGETCSKACGRAASELVGSSDPQFQRFAGCVADAQSGRRTDDHSGRAAGCSHRCRRCTAQSLMAHEPADNQRRSDEARHETAR